MKLYKETEFKETPIGKIPKKWKIINLGSIAKIYAGNTAPQDEKYFKNGKYPFIRVQHLTELQEQKYPVKYDLINEYAVSDLKLKKFKKGSIIFPKSGESIRLEKRAILKEDSYVVNHLAVVEPFHENIDNLFLFYYLCTVKTSNYLLKTTMPSLNLSTISNFLVPLPPIKEQQTIADILSTVDKAIQRTDEIIAKTERLKKALMNVLLMGRIRVREENGKPVFYRETEFQKTEIGKIPREWKIVYLGELFEFQRGLSYRKNDLSSTRASIRFVTINDLEKEGGWKHNGEPVYLSDGFKGKIEKKHVVDAGDLLIAITDMSKGFIIGAPLYINEDLRSQGEILVYSMDLVKLQPKKQVNALFYYYQLSWSEVRKTMKSLARGTNVLHLDLNSVKRIKLVEPPLDEQQRIAEILSIVDRVIELYREERIRLDRLKRGLMDLLLTGKVRVVED
jgi:type I restriction enzyme S subunit